MHFEMILILWSMNCLIGSLLGLMGDHLLYWIDLYVVKELARYGPDHCPLVLHTSMVNFVASSIFKCDIS
jgi:hypothetical protein